MSAERIHAQEQPAPDAFALMRGEVGGDPADDERHREVVADLERHLPACRTPGAIFTISIGPSSVGCGVSLRDPLTLSESEAACLENELHDAVEGVLGPYVERESSRGGERAS